MSERNNDIDERSEIEGTDESLAADEQVAAPRPGPLRRLGCGVLLVFWFLILLLPCFLIVLATQGEIRVSLGDLPGQDARVWLVMEIDQRGIATSLPSVRSASGEADVCLQTAVNYLLWVGDGAEESVHYCQCFAGADDNWTLVSSSEGDCSAP